MNPMNHSLTILLADDDPYDCLMVKEALKESRLMNPFVTVEDGVELLEYLRRQDKFSHLAGTDLPGLILLDLNMPRMDGREALKEIKSDEKLKHIPIVVLTTSKAEEDVFRTYNLGVNSFVTKPVTFDSLVDLMQQLGKYWFELVLLPHE